MTNINFTPKDVQGILSLHKILKMYTEKDMFYRKSFTQTLRNIHGKPTVLESLFNVNIARFLGAFILTNNIITIIVTTHMGSEDNVSSKTK